MIRLPSTGNQLRMAAPPNCPTMVGHEEESTQITPWKVVCSPSVDGIAPAFAREGSSCQ